MHLVNADNAGPCGPGCVCETGGKFDPEMFEEGDECTVSSSEHHSLTQFTPAGEWAPAGAVLAFDEGVTVAELREALAFLDETDVVTSSEVADRRTWVEFEPAATAPARTGTPVMGVIGVALILFVLSAFRPMINVWTPNTSPSRRRPVAVVRQDVDRVADLGRRVA